MSAIKLRSEGKRRAAVVLRTRYFKALLSKENKAVSEVGESKVTIESYACGLAELLDIVPDLSKNFLKSKNSLAVPPLLAFTVASGETPKEIHLYHTDGSGNYVRACIITLSEKVATKDTVFVANNIEIEVKGSGDV